MNGNITFIQSKYETYDGSLESNHVSWLRGYEAWANYSNLGEAEKCNRFPRYLTGAASNKYHSWGDTVKRDWNQLRRAFLEYGGSPERKKLWTTEIIHTKCEKFSNVDLYIDKITDLGQKLGLADQEIMMYLVNNLSPPLYTAMLPISCTDLSDAIDKIRMLDRGGIANDIDPRNQRSGKEKSAEDSNSAQIDVKYMKDLQQALESHNAKMEKSMAEMRGKVNTLQSMESQIQTNKVCQVTDPSYTCHYVEPHYAYYEQPVPPSYDAVLQSENTTDPYISVLVPNPAFQPPY